MAFKMPEKQPGRRPVIVVDGNPFGQYMHRADAPPETLIINMSSSICNACGGDASPREKSHESLIGYVPSHEQGCGVVWTHVTTNYYGNGIAEAAQEMRPDLTWVPLPGQEG